MASRSEYRNEKKLDASKPHKHWIGTIFGIIAGLVLFTSLLINSTILNESFMTKQITRSSVVNTVHSEVNSSLSSYGINQEILTTAQTKKIVKQITHEVYNDQTIHINVSSILGNVEGKASSELSQYGISSDIINSLPTGSVNSQISTIINSRLNSSSLQNLEVAIKSARIITITLMIVAVIVLLLICIRNVFTNTVVRDFRWITLFTGILSAAILMIAKNFVNDYTVEYASYKTSILQISNAVLQIGWQMVIVILVISIVLFGLSVVFKARNLEI